MREPLRLEPLFPDRNTGEPLAVQLVRRLREAIEAGSLAPGTKLLGSRQLAKRLGLGRNTVALAFEQLTAEGYLEARSGSGTFVAASGIERRPQEPHADFPAPDGARRIGALRAYFETAAGDGPLRPGMPALALFPTSAWRGAARRALDATYDLGYGPASGLRELRDAIAMHVRQFRGINARPDQIIVVEGAQAAMHLANLVLTRAGDIIAIEDPAYALARASFEGHGLQLHPVRVDRDGVQTDALPARARCAFVTPTHQFPLGGTLPLARRLELLAWAKRYDSYILEDDYDSEFTARARPLPALQSLDRDERVIYIGSFSKTLAPGIRTGYLVIPPHLARIFRTARASTSLGLSLQAQLTLATFLLEGHFARHIRRMNAIYERRRTILAQALASLEGAFTCGPMQVGLHIALVANEPFDDQGLSRALDGQRLVALSSLCIARTDCAGFTLGFTNGTDADVESAGRALVAALRWYS
ncbi:MAG TPA: PLP-dependent aminotransferase family protein [Candidatus Baltobacteraceae bacterium]|nr:PLP-dependent aminotransferase family protein [Candidatus Baltobacteraceae bacterium]